MKKVNLNEILHPQMDVLFVALNPPAVSNENGHYFSRNSSFWNLLYNAGLITQRVSSPLTADDEVFKSNAINYKNAIYGVTDMCNDVVETKSSLVKVDRDRLIRIEDLLKKCEVKNLCLMHAKVGEAFQSISSIDRNKRYGMIGRIGSTNVFEMPFHNASIAEKHSLYKKILPLI